MEQNVSPSRFTAGRTRAIGEIVCHAQLGQRQAVKVTNGRTVVRAAADIDWDKGTTLAWIRDLIDATGFLLPIYIGDDLTDEDAFDAVQFDGIGIVGGTTRMATARRPPVRSASPDRGARVRAARVKLAGGQTRDIGRGSGISPLDGYDPQNEKLRETLCTLGNGYFATRGAAPESRGRQVHYPGTYVAGCTTGSSTTCRVPQIDNESLVNLPNWLALTFRVDGGSWFDIDAVTVLSHRQTLDLRGAVLTREVRLPRRRRPTTSLTQRRFVAMHMPHVGALETTIVAEDWSGTSRFARRWTAM